MQLKNPNDTVEFTDFKYATLFSKPYITYTNNNSSANTPVNETDRAICIIVLEVTKKDEKALLDKMAGFSTKNAVIKEI